MWNSLFAKWTTKKNFNDGSSLYTIHRYALRYEKNGCFVDIGFEQALESGVDRLVHIKNIKYWDSALENELLSVMDYDEIIKKIDLYCVEKHLTYKLA